MPSGGDPDVRPIRVRRHHLGLHGGNHLRQTGAAQGARAHHHVLEERGRGHQGRGDVAHVQGREHEEVFYIL